jgi:hypothetical protein
MAENVRHWQTSTTGRKNIPVQEEKKTTKKK